MTDDDCCCQPLDAMDPGCPCHGQIDGQEVLLPDPRTTTEVPF